MIIDMERGAIDRRLRRLLDAWHLQSKPGVLTASLFTLLSLEVVMGLFWPGLRSFVLAQLGLMLIVVLAVALVDAGNVWDHRLFDDFYRPDGTLDDGRDLLPAGRFLERSRPGAGLFPSGPDLARAREDAATSLGHPVQGIRRASRDHLRSLPDGLAILADVDEPLELSKGVRALLAPLVVMFVVGAVGCLASIVSGTDPWTWAAVALAAVALWSIFVYVFVHRRYAHMMMLYGAVCRSFDEPR